MTLEEQYISKFNFDLGRFSQYFKFNIVSNDGYSFLPYLTFAFEYEKFIVDANFAKYDNISISFPSSIEFGSCLNGQAEEISEIFSIFSSIIDKFKFTIQQNPLFFLEYSNLNKEIKTNIAQQKTPFNISHIETIILGKDNCERNPLILELLNNNLVNTKINMLYLFSEYDLFLGYDESDTNSILYFDFIFESCIITFVDNFYKFTFKDCSYLFNFEDSIKFLNNFYIPDSVMSYLSQYNFTKNISCIKTIVAKSSSKEHFYNLEKLILDYDLKQF